MAAGERASGKTVRAPLCPTTDGETAIQLCVRQELERYFELLDGEPPSELYRLVMHQVESSLLATVMHECNGNRSRAAAWLGITRGTLRAKINDTTDA